jgi:hypothetical protein
MGIQFETNKNRSYLPETGNIILKHQKYYQVLPMELAHKLANPRLMQGMMY